MPDETLNNRFSALFSKKYFYWSKLSDFDGLWPTYVLKRPFSPNLTSIVIETSWYTIWLLWVVLTNDSMGIITLFKSYLNGIYRDSRNSGSCRHVKLHCSIYGKVTAYRRRSLQYVWCQNKGTFVTPILTFMAVYFQTFLCLFGFHIQNCSSYLL